MHIATLNINGDEKDIRALINTLAFANEITWKDTPCSLDQHHYSRFDFSMTLAESSDPDEVLQGVFEYLSLCDRRGANFIDMGLSAEIALSFALCASEQYAVGVAFSNLQLSKFIHCGVYLRIETQWGKEEALVSAANHATMNAVTVSG
ncbi:hypothetical protein L4C36_00075 [Photobacterium japonica]|uniref:hypothetical protein n=1 Tax=Photobacterium japonica TaxID=2910235 RepID=UPI003D147F9E